MNTRLVYLDEVLVRVGVSYPTLQKEVRRGKLAPPRVLAGRIAWTDGEVEEFIGSLPREHPRGRGRPRKVANT